MADKTGFEKFVTKSTSAARVQIQGPARGVRIERDVPQDIWDERKKEEVPGNAVTVQAEESQERPARKRGRPKAEDRNAAKAFHYVMDDDIRASLERIKQRKHAQSIASLVTAALVEYIERNEG